MKRGWCLKYIYDDDDDDDYDDYDDDYDDDDDGDDWIWAKRACFNDRSVRFTWLLRMRCHYLVFLPVHEKIVKVVILMKIER